MNNESRRPTHGYFIKRTGVGNTIFSILEKKNAIIKVLSFILDESYKYNGSILTNKARMEGYSRKLKMGEKVIYRHLKELVNLKILIKESIGEYKINTNVISFDDETNNRTNTIR